MRPLYEINSDYERLTYECETYAIENGGELPPTLEQELNFVVMERNLKIKNLALWIKNMRSYDEAITEEIRRLENRRKPIRNLSEKIKELLASTLSEDEKYKDGSVSIGWLRSTSCIIDDEELVPEKYYEVVKKIHLSEIKNALKAGEELDCAHLEEKKNIQIK